MHARQQKRARRRGREKEEVREGERRMRGRERLAENEMLMRKRERRGGQKANNLRVNVVRNMLGQVLISPLTIWIL